MELLKFGRGNAKLAGDVHTFSLPAGYTCPGADQCLSRANRGTGKVTDGPDTVFRCFSASQEALFPSVRKARWHNLELMNEYKSVDELVILIEKSLPKRAKIVRIHVAGDFKTQEIFDSWLIVAMRNPSIKFYFYTKSIPFWLERIELVGTGLEAGLVPNFIPTASYGGKFDDLIEENNLRSASVVFTEDEKFVIDDDDSHAMKHGPSFDLLIHGIQPGKTEASAALQALKIKGKFGYGEKADKRLSLQMV